MKLYELFSFDPKNTNRGLDSHNNKSFWTDYDNIGGSTFSNVKKFNSPKRLNQVKKTGRAANFIGGKLTDTNQETDGYLSYIKMVSKNPNNPYFPKVHKLQVKKGPDGKIYYDADLEKLLPYNTPKIIDNDDLMNSLKEYMFNFSESLNNDLEYYEIDRLIKYSLINPQIIKDQNLDYALEKIREIISNSNGLVHNDLSSANMMWRITGNMPQLVITDPIA